MRPTIFISGIGTGVGKTIISAIVTEALEADYCKPIQAGIENMTDTELVRTLISNSSSTIHPEAFRLKLPASPHIAARQEGIKITVSGLVNYISTLPKTNNNALVVEGAGGLLVPINEHQTMLDLITVLNASVIIVSRNYLGSINHSLLTASVLQQANANIAGWVFNDQFMDYENEIASWTNIPKLGSVPLTISPERNFILSQAAILKNSLKSIYSSNVS